MSSGNITELVPVDSSPYARAIQDRLTERGLIAYYAYHNKAVYVDKLASDVTLALQIVKEFHEEIAPMEHTPTREEVAEVMHEVDLT